MSAVVASRRNCNYVDRPLSPKPIAWSSVHKECLLDAFDTLSYISNPLAQRFLEALPKLSKKSIVWLGLEHFDVEVGNHFPITRLFRSCQLVPRTETIRYALFADNVSPIIVVKSQKKLTLLDGNHRSLADCNRPFKNCCPSR